MTIGSHLLYVINYLIYFIGAKEGWAETTNNKVTLSITIKPITDEIDCRYKTGLTQQDL